MTGCVYADPGFPEMCSDNKQLTHYQDEIDETSSLGVTRLCSALHYITTFNQWVRESERQKTKVCMCVWSVCVCVCVIQSVCVCFHVYVRTVPVQKLDTPSHSIEWDVSRLLTGTVYRYEQYCL